VPSSFRFAEKRDERKVTLRLLQRNGHRLGEVTGPRTRRGQSFVDVSERVWPTDPDHAFSAAIRLANLNDLELVVTGDPSVWDASWGKLIGL